MATQLPPIAGDVEAKNIEVGDYVVMKCSDTRDSCALELPGMPRDDVFVWICKVVSVKVEEVEEGGGGDQIVRLRGKFFKNRGKDIRDQLVLVPKVSGVVCNTWDLLNVYDGGSDFVLTGEDIETLRQIMMQILAHEELGGEEGEDETGDDDEGEEEIQYADSLESVEDDDE